MDDELNGDEMAITPYGRRVGERHALPHLAFGPGLPEVLHGKSAVAALDGPVERFPIVEVAFHDLARGAA